MNTALRLVIDDGGQSALFLLEEAAVTEAVAYLANNPDAIVMLVEVQRSHCRHCDMGIVEKAGWVLHRWIHIRSGAYLCWSDKHTQAEPKEGDNDVEADHPVRL